MVHKHDKSLTEKKTVAPIYALVGRLTKAEVKTIDNTVTTTKTEALVETLSDSVIKIKFRRRSTH